MFKGQMFSFHLKAGNLQRYFLPGEVNKVKNWV